jgi:hypothetical protein
MFVSVDLHTINRVDGKTVSTPSVNIVMTLPSTTDTEGCTPSDAITTADDQKVTGDIATEGTGVAVGATTSGSGVQREVSCSNCGSTDPWGGSTWCPQCGFYPSLGKCIDTGSSTTEEPEAVDFWQAVPDWVWVMGGGVVAIAVMTIAVALCLPKESLIRPFWTLTQAGIGLVAVCVAHVSAFLFGVVKSEKLGPVDIMLRPVELWKPSLSMLPQGAWRFWLLAWGLTAAVCAATLIGGVQYSRMFDDWGVSRRGDANVVHAVVQAARKVREGGPESLEEAMDEFTGQAQPEAAEIPPPDPTLRSETVDSLIVGYTTDLHDELSSLLLATVVEGKLRFVGKMSAKGIPLEVRKVLLQKMPKLRQARPFVKTSQSATWLKPALMCRVAFVDWTRDRRLRKPQFRELLAEVNAAG